MTDLFSRLPHPVVSGLAAIDRERLAHELTVVGQAIHERAQLLLATGHRGVELAVVELDDTASRVLQRAHSYQYAKDGDTEPTIPAPQLAE